MKVKKLDENFVASQAYEEVVEDAPACNECDEVVEEGVNMDKLRTRYPELDEAVEDYRKFANLADDEEITGSLDEWALNEAAVRNNVQRNDLRHRLLGEDITLDQAARALETEAEVVKDKTQIEKELDQSLKRALWMQKRDIRSNFPNKLFISQPGHGKTAIIYQWARANDVNIVYKDCKTMDMASLGGILTKPSNPDDPYAGRMATREFHVLNEPRTVLFLDELNRAPGNIQGALLTLINEHSVWDPSQPHELRYLPNFLFTVAAINPPTLKDPALKPLGTAMRNRFKALETPSSPKETLNYLTSYYNDLIKGEDDEEMLTELKGKLALAETILTDPKFTYDTAIDEEEHLDDESYQSLSPRSFTDALENSDGTKAGLLREWNGYCNYEKKHVIEDILNDYVDINDKANAALERDTASDVFKKSANNMSKLRGKYHELNS